MQSERNLLTGLHKAPLLLLLSRFSRVRLCATPEMAAHQVPRPWDSPGKNTGMGCHFLFQCMKAKSESEVAQLCLTLHDPMDCSLPGSMGFSRQEGCHCLLGNTKLKLRKTKHRELDAPFFDYVTLLLYSWLC